MRFEAERKVTNLVADRGEGPEAKRRRHAPERWNYSNGIHETRQLFRVGSKLGEWVVRTILFVRRTPLFFLPRFVSLPSSVLFYNIVHCGFLISFFILSSLWIDRFLSFEIIIIEDRVHFLPRV